MTEVFFFMIHLTFEGFSSQGSLALLCLPFCDFGKGWLAKVALLLFHLPPHLFGGVLNPPGVLLLLEDSVARNEGGGNTVGEGEWDMEPSLCLNQVLHQLLMGKGHRLFP